MPSKPAELPPAAKQNRPAHPGVVVGIALVFLLLCIWVVHQGGITPAEWPASGQTLAGLSVIFFEALPLLVAWWLGAAGYGSLLRQRGVAQVGVGMALLLLLNYIAALAVGFSGWVTWGLCGVGVVLLNLQVLRLRKRARRRGTPTTAEFGFTFPISALIWFLLPGLAGLAMLIVAGCCPPGTVWRVEALGYDVLSYHLQVPGEWVAAGRMVELPHNVYGYLPGLMEAAYASIMSMPLVFSGGGNSLVGSVYACHFFHASFVVLAAAAVASWLLDYAKPTAAAVGGALVLLVPWSIVTGSMAYNEQVAVALAAVGLKLAAGKVNPCGRTAVAVGLLVGAATLAKLTAGFTVALPLGMVLLVRLLRDAGEAGWRGQRFGEVPDKRFDVTESGASPSLSPSHPSPTSSVRFGLRRVLFPAVLCLLVGLVTLSPYLIRNAAWTGNPVFPFATQLLGEGHWDTARAERWTKAHTPDTDWGERFTAVWRQGLGNTGYGAWGGSETPRESRNIARFDHEGGIPILWIAAITGIVVGLVRRETRSLVGVLLFFTLWQFYWWTTSTHLQSRFLILCVLPLCGGTGLLIDGVARLPGRVGALGPRLLGGVLAATLAVVSLTTAWSQTTRLTTPDGRPVAAPFWLLVDSLPAPDGTGVMPDPGPNTLPPGSQLMVIGNNQSLFYLKAPLRYASAFDESPITPILKQTNNPEAVARWLRALGVTHLWIGYSELDRLHATYGFDDAVTSQRLRQIVADWPHLGPRDAPTVLVEVPPPPPDPPSWRFSVSAQPFDLLSPRLLPIITDDRQQPFTPRKDGPTDEMYHESIG